MKKLIILMLVALAVSVGAKAQTRGIYGTIQPYSPQVGTIYSNTFVARTADTAKGVDTVYTYYQFSSPYRFLFDLQTVQKAGAITGTTILQACNNTTNWLTRAGDWQTVSADTTQCTSCAGKTKVYSAVSGTNHAYFNVGFSTFQYWRTRTISTGSGDTTAVTGKCYYSY